VTDGSEPRRATATPLARCLLAPPRGALRHRAAFWRATVGEGGAPSAARVVRQRTGRTG